MGTIVTAVYTRKSYLHMADFKPFSYSYRNVFVISSAHAEMDRNRCVHGIIRVVMFRSNVLLWFKLLSNLHSSGLLLTNITTHTTR